jgi:hypothetical protein
VRGGGERGGGGGTPGMDRRALGSNCCVFSSLPSGPLYIGGGGALTPPPRHHKGGGQGERQGGV